MKIVIDIDENSIEQLFDIVNNGLDVSEGLENIMIMAIANGTPLPKGYGRLIDADSLIKAIEEKAKRLSNADTINGLCGAVALIFDEQTIIEAEKTTIN